MPELLWEMQLPPSLKSYKSTLTLCVCTQLFYDNLMEHSDAGAAVGDAVATFDNVAVQAPRGRFDVEMYLTFLKLVGQVGAELFLGIVNDRAEETR
jgi:hypothetical protein